MSIDETTDLSAPDDLDDGHTVGDREESGNAHPTQHRQPTALSRLKPSITTLTWTRRIALAAWAGLMVYEIVLHGLSFDRTNLMLLLCLGLVIGTLGRRRKAITVVLDWAPFVLVLLLYDWTRDIAQIIDMPTQWHLAADVDRHLFGIVPTLWLQGHLKQPTPPLWEVATSIVYMSYFVVPYVVAAVLWLRDRKAWRRYAASFVALTFLALVGYTLVPAAPPWAAARCTAAQIADHPRSDICMETPQSTPPGGIIGTTAPQPGSAPYVERISSRGWDRLHFHAASDLVRIGQGESNLVAAIPSLHAGLTMLLALFMWPRVKALGKALFLGYALAMAFTLVYTGEHYVFDILLGWGLAAAVLIVCRLVDRWWSARRRQRRHPGAGVAQPLPAET